MLQVHGLGSQLVTTSKVEQAAGSASSGSKPSSWEKDDPQGTFLTPGADSRVVFFFFFIFVPLAPWSTAQRNDYLREVGRRSGHSDLEVV